MNSITTTNVNKSIKSLRHALTTCTKFIIVGSISTHTLTALFTNDGQTHCAYNSKDALELYAAPTERCRNYLFIIFFFLFLLIYFLWLIKSGAPTCRTKICPTPAVSKTYRIVYSHTYIHTYVCIFLSKQHWRSKINLFLKPSLWHSLMYFRFECNSQWVNWKNSAKQILAQLLNYNWI